MIDVFDGWSVFQRSRKADDEERCVVLRFLERNDDDEWIFYVVLFGIYTKRVFGKYENLEPKLSRKTI